jgi:hypothetical protein
MIVDLGGMSDVKLMGSKQHAATHWDADTSPKNQLCLHAGLVT